MVQIILLSSLSLFKATVKDVLSQCLTHGFWNCPCQYFLAPIIMFLKFTQAKRVWGCWFFPFHGGIMAFHQLTWNENPLLYACTLPTFKSTVNIEYFPVLQFLESSDDKKLLFIKSVLSQRWPPALKNSDCFSRRKAIEVNESSTYSQHVFHGHLENI